MRRSQHTLEVHGYPIRVTRELHGRGQYCVTGYYTMTWHDTPREAIGAIRQRIARIKARAGASAARRQWDGLCRQQQVLASSTADGLLRCRETRQQVARLIDDRKQYTAELTALTSRRVIREARERLAERRRRRADRAIAETARGATADENRVRYRAVIVRYRAVIDDRRRASRERLLARLESGKLGVSTFRAAWRRGEFADLLGDVVSSRADALVRAAVRSVGPIGEQAAHDLAHMATDESFRGKRGRHHRLDRTTIERIEHLPDWSAALITMRDYKSFGRSGWGDDDRYGSRGGSSYRCYLVVRDSTTGESHLLRVPPKFGNADTQFFGRFTVSRASRKRGYLATKIDERATTRARITAALDWTFGQVGYRPDQAVQA